MIRNSELKIQNYAEGVFAIWKPKGPTSHDVINQLRKITGIKTIGHAGTLDPLASGVLVVAIGRENTKKISESVNTEKEYIAKVKLGEVSATDDAEGPISHFSAMAEKCDIPNLETIRMALGNFIGNILQVPPDYSAVKIGGKKLYKLARRGKSETVTPEPRPVFIKSIEVIEYSYPYLQVKITTGKGAYIRAIARDLGRELKTGAYLAELERTRVGEFSKANSLTIEEFAKLKSEGAI